MDTVIGRLIDIGREISIAQKSFLLGLGALLAKLLSNAQSIPETD